MSVDFSRETPENNNENNARRLKTSPITVGCGRGLLVRVHFLVQRHFDRRQRHDLVPRHVQRFGLRPERASLELEGYRLAAVDHHVEPADDAGAMRTKTRCYFRAVSVGRSRFRIVFVPGMAKERAETQCFFQTIFTVGEGGGGI